MQRHLNQTGSDLEELIGTRSRAIARKLESVQELDPAEAVGLLGLEGTRQPDSAQNVGFDQGETAPRLRRRGDSGGKM